MEGKNEGAGRKFGTRLTFTSLFTAVVVILAAITAAYVLGVMAGREALMAPAAGPEPERKAPPAPGEQPMPDKVLRPQELEYARILRDEAPARQKEASEAAAPTPSAEAAQNVEAPPEPAPLAPDDGSQWDFVFQMAALRDPKAADQLREKLEGEGLRTRLERSGKLLLVLVSLRGDAARAREVIDIAGKLRLGDPLVRSRKPVAQ